jgi:hypothetical protein
MNLENIILVSAQFKMEKPVQGQIDNQMALNTQVAKVENLRTTAQVKLDLTLKAHEGAEQFGTLELVYFIPIEFDADDILDQQVVGKSVTRQMIPLLASDINFYLAKACVPVMPATVLLKILKNQ